MIRNVVILGGGTAGWMTATYLRATFGGEVDITVVESKTVGTIGVGEATFSTIRHFFDYLGLREPDWMPACNAAYKLGIRFENWRHPGHVFYHPFERPRLVDGFPLTEWWLRLGGDDFDQDTMVLPSLIDAQRAPKTLKGELFEASLGGAGGADRSVVGNALENEATQFPYAYHFDAALLADFLAEFGMARGVRRVLDDVVDVGQDEAGWITHLRTAEHGDVTGDLFVDCTGFRGMLIGKVLDEPFESYQDHLPNNRAVALRVPVDVPKQGIRPCTTATAMDAGWIWTIPLFHRVGTGYVYSDRYCDPEEAERTLRAKVGPAAEDAEANHIQMRIGRRRNSWVRNCVAVGLSSGFVEPLESTGIFFIQFAIEQIVRHFPAGGFTPAATRSYNRLVANCLDGVRDFLVLHYRCAGRADNRYWQDAKERELPDGLAERLEIWADQLPDAGSVNPNYHGFEPYSYAVMLLGLGGVRPPRPRGAVTLLPDDRARAELARVRTEAAQMRADLPSQYEYLAHLH